MDRIRLSGGTELAFTAHGETSKPAVLLLHGTPNSSRMFREVAPALAQAAYVIAPDLPGHGESDAMPDVSFSAIARRSPSCWTTLESGRGSSTCMTG